MPLVQAINVAKSYSGPNGAYALKPTSVQIDHGEFVAIVGTSGSGKSTLMNILGLLDRPTAGRLLFEGRDCGAMSFDGLARLRNRRIGFVFQHYHLLPRMTVVRNVELPLAYAGVPPRERRRRAEAALEAVSLPRKSDRRPTSLSGGEQQRVAIARAIVAGPAVLFADEPTGALDTASSRQVIDLILSLHAAGMTIAVVTHDPRVAAFAPRIVLMRDGEIVADGPREALPRSSLRWSGGGAA
jgi:putative ABC transport system ATP-binding protein